MVRLAADGALSVEITTKFNDLPLRGLAMTAVDMPIGLPDAGARGCDFLARDRLPRERKSSVFLYFRRPLLGFATYPEANAWGKSDGKGLAKQAWFLLPRIADIDAWITPARQRRVRESHPELVFFHLNDRKPLPKKSTPEGLAMRRRVLQRHGLQGIDALADRLDRRKAKLDDLYDAAALAIAARCFAAGEGTCLDGGRDARGLRMEIWY
jgi:predicted RNase H-like nuclease